MAHERILVTGAQGTLGSDLLARLSLFHEREAVGTARSELDLSWEPSRIHTVLTEINPTVIINTAAFTAVDAAEERETEAFQVNEAGPRALAEWTTQNGRYLIHISTDYVFDGTKGSAYTPVDSPNPINRYGASKLAGEKAVMSSCPNAAVVIRTSWLFGPGGKNFVPFVLRAAQSQTPINVANDQWGTPTWTGNLCKMLLEVLESRPTDILHGTATGSANRYEQARYLCECLGVDSDFITPVATTFFNFPAQRPQNTSMVSSFSTALDWQTATDKFMQTQGHLKSHV
jgi:dTDP-4-dehydrorhamnose reductase